MPCLNYVSFLLVYFKHILPYQDGLSPVQAATQPDIQWEVAEWLLSLGAQSVDGILEMVYYTNIFITDGKQL